MRARHSLTRLCCRLFSVRRSAFSSGRRTSSRATLVLMRCRCRCCCCLVVFACQVGVGASSAGSHWHSHSHQAPPENARLQRLMQLGQLGERFGAVTVGAHFSAHSALVADRQSLLAGEFSRRSGGRSVVGRRRLAHQFGRRLRAARVVERNVRVFACVDCCWSLLFLAALFAQIKSLLRRLRWRALATALLATHQQVPANCIE